MACPSDAILRSYLEGDLDPVLKLEVESHCDRCVKCIRFLESASEETRAPEEVSSNSDSDCSFDIVHRLASRLEPSAVIDGAADDVVFPIVFGEYDLLEIVGRGGMGVVYKAHQRSLNRTIALKMVTTRFDSSNLAERFQVEAKSVARLNHPGIVPIYEVGRIGPVLYFSMAYYPNSTLANIAHDSPPNFRRLARLVQEVAEAVHYAHQRGVIHRDLKPSNILLDHDGSPKVSDFGLAKVIDSTADLTSTGEVLGTPGYMAPEQATGKTAATIKSDVYGLGAVLYFLISGKPPFSGSTPIQTLYRVVHEEPESLRSTKRGIPADLITIVHKCLAKRAEDRYDSAAEVAGELRRYLNGEPIVARPLGTAGRLKRWAIRNPALAAMTLIAIIFLTLGSTASVYFGVLAQNRANDLSAANKKLEASAAAFQNSAAEAQKQAALATQLGEVTTQVLEQTLYDLQEIVMSDPAQQDKRRSMLLSVLNGLDNLDKSNINNPRLVRSRATALYGLAEVVSQRGDERGNTGATASRPYYEQAIQLFRDLQSANGTDPQQATVDLADAVRNYGDMLAEAGVWGEAHRYFQEADDLISQVAPQLPDDPQIQALAIEVRVLLAETTRHTGNSDLSGEMLKAVTEQCRIIQQRFPDHEYINNELVHALVQLGDWYRSRNLLDDAFQCFNDMKTEVERISETHGRDAKILMDLSTAHERLGVVQQLYKNNQASLEEHLESLKYAKLSGSLAPNNDHVQWDVSFSYQQVADAYMRLGQPAEAIPMSDACSNIRRRLASQDPSNQHLHYKLLHSLKTAAAASEQLEDYESALKYYDEIIEVARAFNSHNDSKVFESTEKQARHSQELCRTELGIKE